VAITISTVVYISQSAKILVIIHTNLLIAFWVVPRLNDRELLLFVNGFAKRGLPHAFNLLTLAIHNFRLETAIALKFGQQ